MFSRNTTPNAKRFLGAKAGALLGLCLNLVVEIIFVASNGSYKVLLPIMGGVTLASICIGTMCPNTQIFWIKKIVDRLETQPPLIKNRFRRHLIGTIAGLGLGGMYSLIVVIPMLGSQTTSTILISIATGITSISGIYGGIFVEKSTWLRALCSVLDEKKMLVNQQIVEQLPKNSFLNQNISHPSHRQESDEVNQFQMHSSARSEGYMAEIETESLRRDNDIRNALQLAENAENEIKHFTFHRSFSISTIPSQSPELSNAPAQQSTPSILLNYALHAQSVRLPRSSSYLSPRSNIESISAISEGFDEQRSLPGYISEHGRKSISQNHGSN